MPGGDKQTAQTTQSSVTNPWGAAEPLLTKLVGDYSGMNPGVTAGQTNAIDNLTSAASGIPNFGAASSGALSSLFGSSTAPQVGMLSDAYKTLQGNIGGTASGAQLDPYSTPGFGDALKTMTSDITNSVKGVYAGSGRDPSGAGSFAQSLGRGLTQGEAPVIQAQANQNKSNQMAAANTLFGAGNTTAGNITGQNQIPLTNAATAVGLVPGASTNYTAPGATQLGAENTAYQLPYGNLAQLLTAGTTLGGVGGSSSGTGTQTQTTEQNPLSTILGAASGGLGLLKLMSDKRVKDNIEEVGELHDGQPIYRYQYKGNPTTHIGLLAQDVARVVPDAVDEFDEMPGLLGVDYRVATQRAAEMGRAA